MTPGPGIGDADLAGLMDAALALARTAESLGEVPIGAVVALDGVVIGSGHNRTIVDADPTAHAEIVALRDAAARAGNHRLTGAVLVTTLEPCLMCCGAAVEARIARIIHAADDPKAGASSLLSERRALGLVHHHVESARGPRGEESARLLREFFAARRGAASRAPA